uniref:Uncharacterized protein n=1 Tax=Tetradesmus obliquus TaxID=3088 RepID=A0A383VL51_TETOB|eukprot:jgi/Sobl393_1/12826/SZX66267.1
MANNDAVLAELEAQLRAPDSILEPGVLDLLKDYLRAGGKPQAAIEDLSENYCGYAQMCNVMCEWLEIADVRTSSSKHGSSGGARAAAGPSSAAAAGGGGAAGEADGGVPDEFTLLSELAKERFDAARFLGVFRRGHPEWLNELIADRRGRQLIYELSAAHRNSLLLNYAIQRILKQGHEEEVALVGGSLASYFEVYHRLLATRLAAAARATTSKQLAQIAAEIAESCVASQHTYVHAQQLLAAAASWPGGGVFRRLGQEVEAAAVAQHGGTKVYQLQPLLVPLAASPEERRAVGLVSEVLTRTAPSLPGGATSSSQSSAGGAGSASNPARAAAQLTQVAQQLRQLLQLYTQQQEQQQQQQVVLSVQPLQHPRLMQLMLSGMFALDGPKQPQAAAAAAASQPKGPDLTETCVQLLALAVAGPQQQQQQQQDQQQQQQQQQQRGSSPVAQVESHATVEGVARLLRQALQLTQMVSGPKAKLGPAELDIAAQVCKQPIAALGLLQHSQAMLSDANAYGDDKLAPFLPNHLSLLHRVACEQPSLIAQVLGVLRAVLGALGHNRPELSRKVLGFLVSLLVSGAADAAMDMAQDWAATADPSLIRHFIQLVLESVEPPYSASFARSMLRVMQHSLFTRLKASHTAMLQQFAAGCREVAFLPPLSRKDEDLLLELAK